MAKKPLPPAKPKKFIPTARNPHPPAPVEVVQELQQQQAQQSTTEEAKQARANVPPPGRHAWKPLFIEALATNGGHIGNAINAAGTDRTTHWEARQSDPDFAAAELAAFRRSRIIVEDAAYGRAIDGIVTSITTYPDGRVIEKREYSDTLLLRCLERLETNSWRSKLIVEQHGGQISQTRAERKAKLERARAKMAATLANDSSGVLLRHGENGGVEGAFTEKTGQN